MKKEKDKDRKMQENGFTLIEVMVAIAIFSIALLGIAALQLGAIKANSSAMGTTEALNVAQNKMEELISLPIGNLNNLVDNSDNPDPNDSQNDSLNNPIRRRVLTSGPGVLPVDGLAGSPEYNNNGQPVNTGTRDYYVYWNINDISINSKEIRVVVAWKAEDRMNRLDLSCIKF